MTFIEIQEFIEQLVATAKAEVLAASNLPPHLPTYPSEEFSDLLLTKISDGFDTIRYSEGIRWSDLTRDYDRCKGEGVIVIELTHVSWGSGPGQPSGEEIIQRYRLEVVDDFYPMSR